VRKTVSAWLIGIGMFAFVGVAIVLGLSDSLHHADRLGDVESWSKAFPAEKMARPEVLETGLDEVRGLTYGPDGKLYLAKSDGKVVAFAPVNSAGKQEEVLPDSGGRDLRGVAFAPGGLVIAAHGRGLIIGWDVSQRPVAQTVVPSTGLTGPSGIAVAGTTMFVTDDRPWPAPGQETAFDSSDYSRWLDKSTQRLFGVLTVGVLNNGAFDWTAVPVRLRHPSGVAALQPNGPVYVAEADASEIRWPIFTKGSDGKWAQTGALGTFSTDGVVLPPFLGVAIAGKYIVAAGPHSLYVFDGTTALGRIVFDYPVSGVAANGNDIFLVVGDRLCHTQLR